MRVNRHLLRLLSAALVLTVTACGVDRSLPTGAVPTDSEMSRAERNAALNAEQVRTTNAALASVSVYDSLVTTFAPSLLGDLTEAVTTEVSSLLLRCAPQPYDADVKVIGVMGGALRAGPHTLFIPSGALKENTVITMEAPTSRYAQVEFAPHGLKFTNWQKPVLTLSYEHCSGLGTYLPKKIVYTDDLLKILETLLSYDMPKSGKVSAALDHFSSYVVAY